MTTQQLIDELRKQGFQRTADILVQEAGMRPEPKPEPEQKKKAK